MKPSELISAAHDGILELELKDIDRIIELCTDEKEKEYYINYKKKLEEYAFERVLLGAGPQDD